MFISIKPGFYLFQIKVQIIGIPEANLAVLTVEDNHKSGSEEDFKQNKLSVELSIPANSRALVYIHVFGTLIVDYEKIKVEFENGSLIVEIGSGRHIISIVDENKSHCNIY